MRMNILVTLNSHYIKPLKVMLKSLFINNPRECFHIYLMHSSITEGELAGIQSFVEREGQAVTVITVGDDMFRDAPVIKHYSKEMYYRILAYKFLPEEMDTILYLDPDIIIINEIRSLYETDISQALFAAAYHDRLSVKEINRLRLRPYDIEAYYNSGVLLMNLALQRQRIDEREVFAFVEENKLRLILPDQDIINALYAKEIVKVDEVRFNYDPRYYFYYKLASNGRVDMDYVVKHSSIIHFCGRKKPWNKNYSGNFHSLYKHYEKIALMPQPV